jgi:HPt (histidine-containing phosphotransfer) domain-containing protein
MTHTLKNSAENLGAKPLSEAAFAIEKVASAGQLDGAAEALANLDRQLAELLPEVEALTTA